MGYAFVDHVTPGITDLMQLEVYDGMDPSKLTLNVVRAPNCDARLLNVCLAFFPFSFFMGLLYQFVKKFFATQFGILPNFWETSIDSRVI